MTSLSKQWDQDAVPAAHVIDVADGLRDGYTETSQVFVETLDVLSREQIEAFAAALPEGSEINFTRYPNGYEFNVFTFDQETFDPATPNPQDVGAAANAMLAVSDIRIKNIEVKTRSSSQPVTLRLITTTKSLRSSRTLYTMSKLKDSSAKYKGRSMEDSKTSQKSKSLKSYDGRVQVNYLTRQSNSRIQTSEWGYQAAPWLFPTS